MLQTEIVMRADDEVHWTLEVHPAQSDELECFEQAGDAVRDYGVSREGCDGEVWSEWAADRGRPDGRAVPAIVNSTVAFELEARIRTRPPIREVPAPDIAFGRSARGQVRAYEARNHRCDFAACIEEQGRGRVLDEWVFDEGLDLVVARRVRVGDDVIFAVRATEIEWQADE